MLCTVDSMVMADKQPLVGEGCPSTGGPQNNPPHSPASVRQSSCTQILKMKRDIAEEEFISPGSFVVKMQIVFPGEANPSMNLY